MYGTPLWTAVLVLREVRLKDGRTATIRHAVPTDADAAMELTREVTAERVYVMTDRLVLTPEQVRQQLNDADDRSEIYLVAEVEGSIVGEASFRKGSYAKNAHTGDLWVVVRKDHRSRGVGEALLRTGIDWARSAGIRKLKLRVFATNEVAQHLYRKLGFVEEARLGDEVMIDGRLVSDVLMALWLA